MSAEVERVVSERSRLRGCAKAILQAIARYVDEDGRGAYPSVARLARDTGVCVRTVQNALNAAIEAGELKRIYNYGLNGTNRYEIHLDRLRAGVDCTGANPAHKGSSLRGKRSSSGSYPERMSNGGARPTHRKTTSREPAHVPTQEDHRRRAEKNGYMSCPDCGHFGGGCHCGDYLTESFDTAMRDTLDAGRPGPAQLASEAAIREAYAKPPGPPTQDEVDAGWEAYERELSARLERTPMKSSASQMGAIPDRSRKPAAERVPTHWAAIPGRNQTRADSE